MNISGWRYYNHAAVPTTAPHAEPNLAPLEDKSIWKIHGGTPLLARWTTDFDCGYETNWWYIIRKGPFEFEALDSKVRKHIRQSLKKVYVKRIDMDSYAEMLCTVHNKACEGYTVFTGDFVTPEFFMNQGESVECWGAFSNDTDNLIGYMKCGLRDGYAETITAKYDPQYLNLRTSDAIHFTVLDYYLNQQGYAYVSSGSRTINHTTNAQDYKISTFGFQRAYCKLHIAYNPKIKWAIKVLYPFRKLLYHFDNAKLIHQINAIMRMEELVTGKDK